MTDTPKTDATRCKKRLIDHSMAFPRYHQCKFKAKTDGYCAKHHPDAVKKRTVEKAARWEAKRKNSPLQIIKRQAERIAQLERELAATEKAADDADTDKLRAIGLYESAAKERDAAVSRLKALVDGMREKRLL